ncbi:MAG: hypothetical protein ISR55_08025 [Bacteroidetes bacterium]|nr:hypothetical protein [Bacteroidota bacterium]MBL6963755.1 hypothetical protein [Bacteroidota bacterium]
MKYLLFLLILSFGNCFSQTDSALSATDFSSSPPTFFPNTLSTHPFGILMSRINPNFQMKASRKMAISLNVSNGNVWLPTVKAYLPGDKADKQRLQEIAWHKRIWHFDKINDPSRSIELHADALIRLYQIRLEIPISPVKELKINTRFFTLDPGKFPFSCLTNDEFIEWFHTHIAGDDDPFARMANGCGKTRITYVDQYGKTMQIGKGYPIFSGIEFSYNQYPQISYLQKRNMYTCLSFQAGINVSKFNPSLDFGYSTSINKQIKLKTNNILLLGVSAGVLQQKLLMFGPCVEISSSPFIFSSELIINYQRTLKNNSLLSIGTSFYLQSAYNKKEDYKSIVLTGDYDYSAWHYSISHLYRNLNSNSLFVSFSKGSYALSVYLREDFLVDNAPDLQTGIGFKLSF